MTMSKGRTALLTIVASTMLFANTEASANEDSCFVVDEESRTPEGSVYVTCEIFEPHGKEYRSTRRSIPAKLVEQIRHCALQLEEQSLRSFGVTPESVRAKVELLLEYGALPSSDPKKYPHPTFEQKRAPGLPQCPSTLFVQAPSIILLSTITAQSTIESDSRDTGWPARRVEPS